MLELDLARARYLLGVADVSQLPADLGHEVAFAGRSNAGKSSSINTLTQQKKLAKTSKTPGRTQLINFFGLTESQRLVDLPGYGFAKAPERDQKRWEKTVTEYLESRQSLEGIVLVMDSRHPLKTFDINMINWSTECQLPIHILLTKVDKLNNHQKIEVLKDVKLDLEAYGELVSVQLFSSKTQEGLPVLKRVMHKWLSDSA